MFEPLDPAELSHAWERVLENAGCGGADGVTIERFAHDIQGQLSSLARSLAEGTYAPWPLLKIVIEKQPGSGEGRQLLVPTVRDRVVQTAVARRLSRSYETEFLECSFAYRPGRSVDRAIARIRKCHALGYRFAVDADIHAFFDSVDHTVLLARIGLPETDPEILDLIRQWIQGPCWDGERLQPLKTGIPQGSPVSPLLANLFLQDFDFELEKAGRKLIRYADDFLVLARTPEEASAALRESTDLLESLHLELNLEKTRVTDFESGFRFLGALFLKDATWIPWKQDVRTRRVLFVARPLPPAMRRRFESPARASRKRPAVAPLPVPDLPNLPKASLPVAFLYLTEQGSVLRKSGDRLLVEKDDEVLLDLPYHKLENIVLFGNIQVTTQAVGEILEKGINLAFFSRQGNYRGALSAPRGRNIDLRLAQFDRFRDAASALALARGFVAAKIRNATAVLRALSKSSAATPEFRERLEAVERAAVTAEAAPDLAALDGVEGAAARQYFDLLMTFNLSAFVWPGRVHHPATDPLNALLSFAYTLLTHELSALLEGSGLDPYLGYLHQPDYGRASLALDVLEPFRNPVADRFVLRLVNLKTIGEDDFTHASNGACYLSGLALKRFFAAWEQWMLKPRDDKAGFREILRREVERLGAGLRSNTPFAPWQAADASVEGGECSTSSVTI